MKAIPLTALLVVAFLSGSSAIADGSAPMPQTRGMAGMDPRDHDQPAKDPYEGCVENAEKVAQQDLHPMPQTRGMQGMDAKAHVMDCPPKADAGGGDKDEARHVHRAPGN